MIYSKDAYLTYLEEEIVHTKRMIQKLHNPYVVDSYLREIAQLEKSLIRIKAGNRQNIEPIPVGTSASQVPQVNVPPIPTPDIPTASVSISEVPLTPVAVPEQVFTLEELSQYNGLSGNPAYVALYGLVFDVSNIATWGGGTHFGLFAGTDTTPLARACGFHNPGAIMRIMPAVGRLAIPSDTSLSIEGAAPGQIDPLAPMFSEFPEFPAFPVIPAAPPAPMEDQDGIGITTDTTIPRKL